MTTINTKTLAEASTLVQTVRSEIAKAVIGQQQVVDQLLIALLAAGHILVEGVPGLGKTLLVRALAKTFNGNFARIQFTPDLMPSDITGHAMYDLKSESFKLRKGPIFTNILLADEINRAPAKTQSALLEVMQEQQVTIEGQSLNMDLPFLTMATQNPIEQEGTYPLPEAQLDRFLLKVLIAYPEAEEESQLVKSVTHGKLGDSINVNSINQVLSKQQVLELQHLTASLTVDDRVVDYAVQIVRQTRDWPGMAVGAGPRGSIGLIRAARAMALLRGHDFVTPDDVKDVALPALRHRIVLAPEMEIEGQTPDTILSAVLDSVAAPRG